MHRGTYLQIFSIRTTTSSTLLSSKAERRLAALSFNGRGLSTRLTTWCGRSSQWRWGSPRCWWSVAWCSPWLGQAWRQRLHFCPETFLNLPRPLSVYIDKLGKWIQTKSKKNAHLYQNWKLLYVSHRGRRRLLPCTADEEEVTGFVGLKPSRAAWLGCLSVGLLVRIPNLWVFKCGKLKLSWEYSIFSA